MHIGDSSEEKTKKYPFLDASLTFIDRICAKDKERFKDLQAGFDFEEKAKNWADALKDLDSAGVKERKKPSVAIDFDGTIAKYDHYRGKGVFGEPIEGARNFIKLLKNMGWIVIINTTRSEIHAVESYLVVHDIPYDFINFNPENEIQDLSDKKVLADVYVDDRAVRFDGSWSQAFTDIITARPWWKEIKRK